MPSWKLQTISSAPLVTIKLQRIRKSRCYVAVNNPTAVTAMHVRWHMFKQLKPKQGATKLFSNSGYHHSAHTACTLSREHLGTGHSCRTHYAKTLKDFRWHEDDDGTYVPTVSDVSLEPEAVVELVKCSCAVSVWLDVHARRTTWHVENRASVKQPKRHTPTFCTMRSRVKCRVILQTIIMTDMSFQTCFVPMYVCMLV